MERIFNKTALFLTGLILALTAPMVSMASTSTAGTPTHKHSSKSSRHSRHSSSATSTQQTLHHKHHATKSSHHHQHSHHHASHKDSADNAAYAAAIAQPAPAVSSDHSSDSGFFSKFSHFSAEKIVSLADATVHNLRYTHYKLGGNDFDPTRGVYRLDCSAYVDKLLEQANPQAYSTLAEWSRTYKPTTADYYAFFDRLPSDNWRYWHKIAQVSQLEAGDIMVFRYTHRRAGGHVMLVMGKPVPVSPNVFWVNVADSAASGHSDDTRPAHTSGVGIGKLLLQVDPDTQKINSYAWKAGANWKHNISFVMASPENHGDLS